MDLPTELSEAITAALIIAIGSVEGSTMRLVALLRQFLGKWPPPSGGLTW